MSLQVSVGQWNLEPLLCQAKFARRTQKKPLPTEKKATGSVAVGLLNSRGWGIGLERQFSPMVNGLRFWDPFPRCLLSPRWLSTVSVAVGSSSQQGSCIQYTSTR